MKKKSLAVLMIFVMVMTMMPATAFAAIEEVAEPAEVTELISSTGLEHNFVKVTASGRTLSFQVETPVKAVEFNASVRKVNPDSGSSSWDSRFYPTERDGYYTFSGSLRKYWPDGDYVLVITMKPTAGAKSIVFYKNCNFRIKGGQYSILEYDTIIDANAARMEKSEKYDPSKFTDKKLKDIRSILFKDPVTKKVASVTDKKVAYFKKVAKSVTKGAETDYEKVLKIYEYVAENFYYDDIAFKTKTKQYIDPYKNLYNLRNKKKSANSTSDGKVATVCSGMAGVVIALCRQLDIPARLVNGHHVSLSSPYNNWDSEEKINNVDHWWAEVYVDGRWIVVDPTPGNSNKWNRSKGTWTYTGLTNYIYFDPTPEQLATSHVTLNLKGSYK
ncbi:MAG: transglutaminase domain-containing protein [Firmicutes bacterium]|nr:transglutaminase domain-containing protein [Bacillota bacterium]